MTNNNKLAFPLAYMQVPNMLSIFCLFYNKPSRTEPVVPSWCWLSLYSPFRFSIAVIALWSSWKHSERSVGTQLNTTKSLWQRFSWCKDATALPLSQVRRFWLQFYRCAFDNDLNTYSHTENKDKETNTHHIAFFVLLTKIDTVHTVYKIITVGRLSGEYKTANEYLQTVRRMFYVII